MCVSSLCVSFCRRQCWTSNIVSRPFSPSAGNGHSNFHRNRIGVFPSFGYIEDKVSERIKRHENVIAHIVLWPNISFAAHNQGMCASNVEEKTPKKKDTAQHIATTNGCIKKHGPSPMHRHSPLFHGYKNILYVFLWRFFTLGTLFIRFFFLSFFWSEFPRALPFLCVRNRTRKISHREIHWYPCEVLYKRHQIHTHTNLLV